MTTEDLNREPLPSWTKPVTSVRGVLLRMKQLFEIPGSWTREAFGRLAGGNTSDAIDPATSRVCLVGAACRARNISETGDDSLVSSVKSALRDAGKVDGDLYGPSPITLNDKWGYTTGRRNALALINKALEADKAAA